MEHTQIKEFRKRHGMTQSELAARLGIDQSLISRIEAGGHISGPVRILLKQVLDNDQETTNS